MQELSFFEKLEVLLQNIFAHPLFIIILLLPVIFVLFNKKITKKQVVLIYIAIIIIVLFVSGSTMFALFDNVVDEIFMTLYFPNFITLFITELLSIIITLITFIKKDMFKTNKIINITAFAIIQTIFCLVVTIIKANEIDIYQENALYSNSDVLTLMQLLMGTFFLQITSLLVIDLVTKITNKLDGKEIKRTPIITPYIEPVIKQEKQKPLNKKYIEKEKIQAVKLEDEIKEENAKLQTNEEPLDKTLILKNKINPLNLNDEIKEEKTKNPVKIEPLDKTLILNKEITPVNLNDKIKEENTKLQTKIEPLDKTLILENKINSFNLNEEIEKENKVNDIKNTPVELLEIPSKDDNKAISFADFKPEFPENVDVKPDAKEELIDNLTIVDFEKAVKLIPKIKRVYTL